MAPRGARVLSPLPLFDEASLLAACANHDQPIAAIHARTLWKALLRHELDQYHPGYIERMNSRMGSRATSRMASRAASRTSSRRGSVDATTPQPLTPTLEGLDEEETETKSEHAASSSAIIEGDEASECPSGSTAGEEEDAAALARRFELEAAIRRKLEDEDDALLVGLSVFPRSRFDPSDAELADESNPMHTKEIVADSIADLPKRIYPLLAQKFSYLTSRLQSHKTSADGSTTKLLIRLQDGQHIESVIMRRKKKDVATGMSSSASLSASRRRSVRHQARRSP